MSVHSEAQTGNPDDTKIATMEDYAKMDFEPWDKESSEQDMLSDDDFRTFCNTLFMVFKFSHKTMYKTKTEIMDDVAEWDDEQGELVMNAFAKVNDQLKGFKALIGAAEVRVLCAGAALGYQEQNEAA